MPAAFKETPNLEGKSRQYKWYWNNIERARLLCRLRGNKPQALARKKLYELNPARIASKKAYQKSNREKFSAATKRSYYKHYERNRAKRKDPAYRARVNAKNRSLPKSHPMKIRWSIGRRFALAIEGKNKSDKILNLLGCSVEFFKGYIEAQFKEGMNWQNHGIRGWHYDHIRPCASFDLTNPEEQKKCFHYTNYQPLWGDENIRKSDKWNPEEVNQ